jgi:hypothetical protein
MCHSPIRGHFFSKASWWRCGREAGLELVSLTRSTKPQEKIQLQASLLQRLSTSEYPSPPFNSSCHLLILIKEMYAGCSLAINPKQKRFFCDNQQLENGGKYKTGKVDPTINIQLVSSLPRSFCANRQDEIAGIHPTGDLVN